MKDPFIENGDPGVETLEHEYLGGVDGRIGPSVLTPVSLQYAWAFVIKS